MKSLKRIDRAIAKGYGWIVMVFMAAMTVSLTIQIIFRYCFNIGLNWTEESARFMCIWLSMLGTSILVKESDHIRVSMIEDLFPRLKRYFWLFQAVIMLIFSLFFLWLAFDSLAIASKAISVVLKLPMVIVYLMYPLAGIGMFVHSLCRLLILSIEKTEQKGEERI